jgi:hypothetical protein
MALVPAPATAQGLLPQPDHLELGRQLASGDVVFVTGSGGQARGAFVRTTSDSIVLRVGDEEREIRVNTIAWVERMDRSIWNGALLGGGILGLAGLAGSPSGRGLRGALAGSVVGATVGALIDRAHTGRQLVYGEPTHGTARSVVALDRLWTVVRPNQELVVERVTGERTTARFVEATDDGLTVTIRGEARDTVATIAAADVQRIRRVGRRHTLHGAKVGTAIGLIAGSAATLGNHEGSARARAVELVGFMGAGLLIGAELGSTYQPRPVVYERGAASSAGRVIERERRRLLITPLVGREARGVAATVTW